MSYHVNLTVQFEVQSREIKGRGNLSDIAAEHVARMQAFEETDAFDKDALRLLEYATIGQGVAPGPRGDMFTWGSVGNHSCAAVFVGALLPFWRDLYTKYVIYEGDGIVIMSQQEQRPFMEIFEISRDRTAPRSEVVLVLRQRETSFPLFGWYFERPEGLLPRNVRMSTDPEGS